MHIKPHYQADYDVIVLGFGAAGATAARFAADHNKKVLLVDAAPLDMKVEIRAMLDKLLAIPLISNK